MPTAPTLTHLLASLARQRPDDLAYAFVKDGNTVVDQLTLSQLLQHSQTVAAFLQDHVAPGDRVLLTSQQSLSFLISFFGCLFAGAVAVPAYPPRRRGMDPRLSAIVRDAQPRLALTSRMPSARRSDPDDFLEAIPHVYDVNDLLEASHASWKAFTPQPDDLAYLQYTSGSTSTPRGVMVSHRNVMENLADIEAGAGPYTGGVTVSWVPLFHDLGLVAGALLSLFRGFPCYFLSSAEFAVRPVVWLEALSHFQATHTGAPNFGYAYCVEKVTEEEVANLDLSRWVMAVNAGEPVRRQTIEQFVERFQPAGFTEKVFCPCYGLAESTVEVSTLSFGEDPLFLPIGSDALERRRVEREAAQANPYWAVGCGYPGPKTEVVIVDRDTGRPCAEDEVGEIWVRSPSVARGYWNRPEETAATFGAMLAGQDAKPYLRTGDLGFLYDGQLFVTGRLKELIIIRGLNHYPQDIEASVQACSPLLLVDRGAAFTIDRAGEEQLVIVQEVRRSQDGLDAEPLFHQIAQSVSQEHGLDVEVVVLIRSGTLPRTSSGKIQRSVARERFQDDALQALATWRRSHTHSDALLRPTEPVQPSGREVAAWLLTRVAERLAVSPDRIQPDTPLAQYGLNSITATQLAADVNAAFDRRCDATLFFEYPSINDLSAYLAGSEPAARRPTVRSKDDDAVAVIGMSCRFPGATTPQAFWELLIEGRSAIGPVPDDRAELRAFFDSTAAGAAPRWGGFLEHVDQFDPLFFQLSPGEANVLDPQHRLFLEVTWEALERVGKAPHHWNGRSVGVFAGISTSDYSGFLQDQADPHVAMGNAHCMVANRLSYLFNWQGPSVAIDTACSSSLVAVHQACQSLRQSECELAVAGGVNLILGHQLTNWFHRAGMLAPDGRCKTFDHRADGYVRGEGCGVVILKRLSDAQRDGDRVLAVIRGSAVNQDGRSNGITAPNGKAQEAVIGAALRASGVEPAAISYVEAHGTGTPLGDPIEVKALAAALRSNVQEAPGCMVGSVKTNIGHLEAAAGIAGLIKTVLALQHGVIPPTLHLEKLNARIEDARPGVHFPGEPVSWISRGATRLAGVSAFGFGGTNAHVILEEAPPFSLPSPPPESPAHLLCLSAQNEDALHELAVRWRDFIRSAPQVEAGAMAFHSHTARSHFRRRLATTASTADEFADALDAYVAGAASSVHVTAHRSSPDARVAFLFSGQGGFAQGVDTMLYETFPVFRAVLDECDRLLRPVLGCSIRDHLFPAQPEASRLHEAWLAQPALFSWHYALAQLWRSWGIEPEAVMGHSLGLYAAAAVAGVFPLEVGLKLTAHRGKLMHERVAPSGMVAVWASAERVRPLLEPYDGQLVVAVYAGPTLVVVSGAAEALDALVPELDAAGFRHTRLSVSHGFHAPQMEPALAPFADYLGSIRLQKPSLRIVDATTGEWLREADDPAYWVRHILEPVHIKDSVDLLCREGFSSLLEIGLRASLTAVAQGWEDVAEGTLLPSVYGTGEEALRVLLNTLGELYVRGVRVDWDAFHGGAVYAPLDLPGYPFQRRRCWYTAPPQAAAAFPASAPPNNGTQPAPDVEAVRPKVAGANDAGRKTVEVIQGHLTVMVGRLLQAEPEAIDPYQPFLEMGADSIIIIQAVREIEHRFGVKISIRQLFEEYTTLAALATYIDAQAAPEAKLEQTPLPDDVARLPIPPTPSSPTSATQMPAASSLPALPDITPTASGGGSVAEQIVLQQLQVMQEQLRLLSGGSPAPPPVPIQPPGRVEQERAASPTPTVPRAPFKVSSQARSQLTERQKQHTETLTERFTRRTHTSKELAQAHRPVLADSRAAVGFRPSTKEMLYPLVGVRAEGSRLWDIDGNEYLDLTMGFGVQLCGNTPPFIREALEQTFSNGIVLGPRTHLAGEVAHLMAELTGAERVVFTNSGTEAVMTAIRLARAATGRDKIALFSGSYHGHSDGTLGIPALDGPPGAAVPIAPGVPPHVAADLLVLDYGEPASLDVIKAHAHELAAVLVEPVQSRRPELQPRAFLRRLREVTAEAGVALIFDEMISGFRIHPGGAQAWFGVQADLATYGKIVGGGMPIGVVAGKATYLDGIDGGAWNYGDASYPSVETTFFGGTFCQHPMSMVAAHAMLSHLKAEGPGLQETLNRRTTALAATLNAYFEDAQAPLQVVHFGSLFRFVFTGNMDLFFYHLLDKGVYIWEWRNCFLSTAHTDEDVAFFIRAVRESIEEMRAGGFLPPLPGAPDGGARASVDPALVEGGVQAANGISQAASVAAPMGNGRHAPLPAAPSGKVLVSEEVDARSDKGFWQRHKTKPSLAHAQPIAERARPTGRPTDAPVQFSLSYFGTYEAAYRADKYELLFESARYADEHGFSALWMPERHFHPFGGFSPNPAVLAAALARETRRIGLRAGSVVFPLHHPVRIVEEWSLVDNLSQGRVGVAFASGWHPNDFVFAPHHYGDHRALTLEGVEEVRRLWRGEPRPYPDGAGHQLDVSIFPLPMQADLPVWLTIVNNPETYVRAGELGVGVLTNLMGQTLDDLARNLAVYRESLARHGHDPATGRVTVLLHTFVGDDRDEVIATARTPFVNYLQSSSGLLKKLVQSEGLDVEFDQVTDADRAYLLDKAYQRYVETSALIGTPDSCAPVVEHLRAIGVDEIACFIDFGVETGTVLRQLPHLNALRERYQRPDHEPVRETGAGRRATGAAAAEDETVKTLPLIEAQRQLWVLAQLDETGSVAYHDAVTLQLDGDLDEQALRWSLDETIRRHESLRTQFDADGQAQRVLSRVAPDIRFYDYTNEPADERPVLIAEARRQESRRPFDLTQAPLFRVTVLKVDARRHLLILTTHHIIADGWSLGLIVRELGALYNAQRHGVAPNLEPPMAFSEAMAFWSQQRQTEAMAEHEAYWLHQLSDPLPVLDLPTDRPRPTPTTFSSARKTKQLDADVYAAVKRLSRENGCTSFMTLLAAYVLLLHRLTGQDDLVVGIPTTGRAFGTEKSLVGYCTHLLPIRSVTAAETTVADHLAQTRSTLFDALDHQDYPFADLVTHFRARRDLSASPLVSTVFNLEPRLEWSHFDEMQAGLLPSVLSYRAFDLNINLIELDGELLFECDYNTDLFDDDTVERLQAHYLTLLVNMAADPDWKIAEVPLLSPEERRRVVEEWSTGPSSSWQDACVHELVERQATQTPDATALVFDGGRLSYRELNQRANQLAFYLRKHGVRAESRVGLCLDPSPDMLIALLAVMKAGGAYVPLDPGYPAERLAFLIEDARIHTLVTVSSLVDALPPSTSARLVCLDDAAAKIARHGVRNPTPWAVADNAVYVLYTSGTTGRPKGVVVTHGSVSHYLRWCAEAYGVEKALGAPVSTSLSFDATVTSLLSPLMVGRAVRLLDRGRALDEVAEILGGAERWSLVKITPGHLGPLQEMLPAQTSGVAVDAFVIGGEALLADQLAFWRGLETPPRLINEYGPTEATVGCCVYEASPEAHLAGGVPIGRPIAGARVYVLDGTGHPVPVGVRGELYVGGVGLARGYQSHAALTAERFVPDPFSGASGARLYRTGDVVRYLSDGTLVYVGRLDDQVKILGYRVELGEVESALRDHPAVRQCVAAAHQGDDGVRRLAAYVVAADAEHPPDSGALRAHLDAILPAYMMPSVFMILDALPLTPHGKIDRRALPLPTWSRDALGIDYVAPRDATEELLAGIWTEVLEVEPVGVHDSFFQLGGHSLLATQVISRIRSTFDLEVPLRMVFEAPTIAELALRIGEGRDTATPPIRPAARDGEQPLSFAQQRLWFLDQMGAAEAYNMPISLRLKGRLDEDVLRRTFEEIVRRHEAIRTTFGSREGRAYQVIHAPDTWALPVVDLRHLPVREREAEARRRTQEETERPFDLTCDLPLRTVLLRMDEEDYLLLIMLHHIASDGWSLGVLVRELTALYAAFVQDEPSPLPPLAVQYADFARWQREWLQGAVLEAELDYWRGHLENPPVLELPTDRPRPAAQTYEGALVTHPFPDALSASIKTLVRAEGVTLYMLLLAAFKVLLSRYTGQDDLVVGSPIANRNRQEIEDLIGFFVNTLAIRTDLSGTPTFRELLSRVRKTALEAYAHQDVPFEKLVEDLDPHRTLNQTPLFQVMFAVQNAPIQNLETPGLTIHLVPEDVVRTRFDMEWNVWEDEGGLRLDVYYNDLFAAATMQRLVGHYQTLLEAAVRDVAQPVSALPLLRADERRHLLEAWNQTQTVYPRHRCVQALFEEQVARTPEAVAVVFGQEEWTYSRLNERANQLAHHLRSLGVGPESPVGVCLERSAAMVVGLVGVLKAGGLYVPLDPSYPLERLAFMVHDAQVSVLLTVASFAFDLPHYQGHTVCLDRDAEHIDRQPTDNPAGVNHPENLAYLMYTSGSTGQPKAIGIPHRAIVRLVCETDYVQLDASDVVAQASNASFDAMTFELWGALLHGARLVGIERDVMLSPGALAEALARHQVTTMFLTTALFNQVAGEQPGAFGSLRHVLVGGQAVDPLWMRKVLVEGPPQRLLNAYGPTESTTFASWHQVDEVAEGAATVPIGLPVANTTLYVLDRVFEPAPVGVAGELYIGGDGLARGYHQRPGLTAERFVPDPFSETPGRRLYRTGDLVRRRSDGAVEFVGRIDDQVKLRGFRIELGEIESVLSRHPAVRQSVVLAREDVPGDKRLVAYVVADTAVADARNDLAEEYVSTWHTLYQELYHKAEGRQEEGFDISGWNSSYTGQPIPAEQMQRWRLHTVARIGSTQAQRIWELGCGTGLLLLEVAPQRSRYLGTDFSEAALASLQAEVEARGLPHVTLERRLADDFSGIAPGQFDLVVLNSVVQYFPSLAYLRHVLEGAVESLDEGGVLFVGDVRSLPLLEAFRTSVELYQADATLPLAQLRERVRRALEVEGELALDPEYFRGLCLELPQLSHAEVLLKRGRDDNEMTRYRYDVFLYAGADPETIAASASLDWSSEVGALKTLETVLQDGVETLEVLGVPNARVQADQQAWQALAEAEQTVGELRARLKEDAARAVEPEALWELGERLGYAVRITWSREQGVDGVDVLFERPTEAARRRCWIPGRRRVVQTSARQANNPLAGRQQQRLAPVLRAYLQAKLPAYMMPSVFVMLEALPLTPNGKVDRRALPAPQWSREVLQTGYLAPRNETEERLASIWSEVLGIEQVGVHDNFFDLGGHSLLATQVVSRIRSSFEVELPLQSLFEAPTIAGQAGHVMILCEDGVGEALSKITQVHAVQQDSDTEEFLL